jgi:hypothetical protein
MMTDPQTRRADSLATLIARDVAPASHVGEGVIVVGADESVIVNVSDDGRSVDVARIVRDADGAPVDSVEYLEGASARNVAALLRAVSIAVALT